MSSQYIFQYPTTGRWVCDFPGSSDTIVGMSFQYPTTGRWVCDTMCVCYRQAPGDFQYPTTGRWVCDCVSTGSAYPAPVRLSVPYHGSLGL